MGIFSRFSRMIKANVNALLDAAEDPEKTLNQIIVDMQEARRDVKEQVAKAMVDERKLDRKMKETRAESGKWREKAQVALTKGNEDLAKQALVRYKTCNESADLYEKQVESQRKAVKDLKLALDKMEQKIEDAKRKRHHLLTRKKVAETTAALSQTAGNLKIPNSFGEFDRIAEKIEEMEIKAGVMAELSGDKLRDELDQVDVDHEQLLIEDELAKLKSEMGLIEDKSDRSGSGD